MSNACGANGRPSRRIPLDGPGWSLREALGDTWRWYVDTPLDDWRNNVAEAAGAAQRAPGWWQAQVPGSVITDLTRAGELADPYRGRATRAAEWTGARHWVYRRVVEVPPHACGERAVIELDGVDPAGSVFWDGRLLGRIEGLYHQGRFPIPDDATGPGAHGLTVVLDPVPASQPQVGRTDLVRVHRPRMNEGWDFCPRFPHQGIWRGVRLVLAAVPVTDVAARVEVDADGHGRVELTARLETGDEAGVGFRVAVLDPAGHVVAETRGHGAGAVSATVVVEHPALWWPHGLGPATLYRVRLQVDGADEPAWSAQVGFRRARLIANPGAPAGARAYTAEVNGTVVPLVGWNWVPADAQYGAAGVDRVRHLVRLAARSGARLLRVWGGGLAETEEFYDACDRAGLLVWQEFSQSSSGLQSAPATDAEFVATMVAEAAAVIPARMHHPSLLLWCGGNELDADGVPLDEERSPVLAALRESLERLDPGRAWLPTSPSGPAFHNRLDVIASAPDDQHDVHGPWEHQGLREHHTLYNSGHSLAHTEFGVEGMTNRRALNRLIPTADQWPADRSNPVYRHLGDWWNNAPLVQSSFGCRLEDVDALRRASQLLQATGLAYAVEADRRRSPRCSMVLPWQLNESYPNAWCTSAVDHLGDPKPAYHAVARAFARDRVTVRVPTSVWGGEPEVCAEAWVWSEAGTPAGSQVSARLRTADGGLLAEAAWPIDRPVDVPRPVGALRVATDDLPADAVVIWEMTWTSAAGKLLDHEVVLAATGRDFAPLLDLARAEVAVTTGRPGIVEVAHRAGPAVVGLQLTDARPADAGRPLLIDGDPRPLLPGERRSFAVRGDGPARVLVDAWNLAPTHVELEPTKERNP